MGKTIANNKRAHYDFFLGDTFEAGVVLAGSEVKSLRVRSASFNSPMVRVINEEAFLFGMHIAPYDNGGVWNTDPNRPKKLLLHKKELAKMAEFVKEKGRTIVPTTAYFDKNGRIKVEISLATGKKLYDKRECDAKKQAMRDIERAFAR